MVENGQGKDAGFFHVGSCVSRPRYLDECAVTLVVPNIQTQDKTTGACKGFDGI